MEGRAKKEAYKAVYKDLCRCGMFAGLYDVKNADPAYMRGINTVMEVIAFRAGMEDEYELLWNANVEESWRKHGECHE